MPLLRRFRRREFEFISSRCARFHAPVSLEELLAAYGIDRAGDRWEW